MEQEMIEYFYLDSLGCEAHYNYFKIFMHFFVICRNVVCISTN